MSAVPWKCCGDIMLGLGCVGAELRTRGLQEAGSGSPGVSQAPLWLCARAFGYCRKWPVSQNGQGDSGAHSPGVLDTHVPVNGH